VVLIFAAGLVAATLAVGAGAWWAARAMGQALDPDAWTAGALDVRALPRMFGVRLTDRPARFEGRAPQGGEARFEGLIWFADRAQLEHFVADNHLSAVDAGALDLEADAALERVGDGVVEQAFLLETTCCTGTGAVLRGRLGLAVWLQSTERERSEP
jgi:hypothetical protein